MNEFDGAAAGGAHSHAFLGAAHARNERKTWMVIGLCTAMMIAEIVGGTLFGSLALVADGLHMSTHAGAMLIAALAYTYARRHADDPRFVFGTGKLGDLAGFTSAIVLAMIAVLIGYEAIARLLAPVPIHFGEAIPIAVLGLAVNLASVWLLSGDHHHGHGHGHHHAHGHDRHDDHDHDHDDAHHAHHAHGSHSAAHHDHNIRSAYVHVIADAAVSVLAIVGLLLARAFGWVWMDPLAGIVGALVIANWAYGLMRDTGRILLDVNVDRKLTDNVRRAIEALGDTVNDLHVWRVGPGHMSAIVSVESADTARDARFYHALVAGFDGVSHVTVEVLTPAKAA
ncbi:MULTISPECIES: CDF family Co(II)/Ni(II) efflux transporter DmeF [Burkholderia]|jgi:cation diffusion facilitator family transporter|uniref:Cation efflux protein n=1 Tax=Burkholderia cenocepacia (strain ATCC BAA-245 / DSM 16553 / LMG 16656 / NCTC 13227 / J2315 / CF5610) TaxID=216591 RepID=B4EJG2_BURCJ|nr:MULTISPECIES: CDF family Co(II)/Ni(II) efflux transporter DmeF [Burkholderia]AIO45560.1 cation diffusion facilitator transporter family protein [Burkholderia cepacia]MCO2666940.1 CDF family Co(II)/Ni(II) efflux transporter DmeF [Pseudomonas aeruginosa]ALV58801.1 cation transporter [Burkholderia cenocepacia]AOK37250.1 cation transporter [Burkholderia cenocepacia]AQQ45603.1 cation transporter [Burkholderia cenocepacia]